MNAPSSLPSTDLKNLRELIDRALAAQLPEASTVPEKLYEALDYTLLAPGKRLRPLLLLSAAQACGSSDMESLLPPACAIEMIHAYSLIHDDLPCMDDDELRRGRPTCHRVFGEAVALLAGDALLTLAFEVLSRPVPDLEPRLQLQIIQEVAHAIGSQGMVGGQTLDLAAEQHELNGVQLGEEQLGRIHQLKTGLLIRTSVRIGGLLSAASDEQLQALTRFGEQFGLAFQISDDILDVIGEDQSMGKASGRDAQRGKTTYVSRWGLEGAQARLEEAMASARSALELLGPSAGQLAELLQWLAGRKA